MGSDSKKVARNIARARICALFSNSELNTLRLLNISHLPPLPEMFPNRASPCESSRFVGRPQTNGDGDVGWVFIVDSSHFIELPNFPSSQKQHTNSSRSVHEASEELCAQKVTSFSNDLKGDRLAEGARQDDDKPLEVEGGRKVLEANNLNSDWTNCCPESPGDCPTDESVEDEDAIGLCRDPDGEDEERAREGGQPSHVDAPDAVREVSGRWSPESLAQIQNG